VSPPVHVLRFDEPRECDLDDIVDRRIAYRAVMSEGRPEDIMGFIDRDMLVELFEDIALPPATRAAWQPVVGAERVRARG